MVAPDTGCDRDLWVTIIAVLIHVQVVAPDTGCDRELWVTIIAVLIHVQVVAPDTGCDRELWVTIIAVLIRVQVVAPDAGCDRELWVTIIAVLIRVQVVAPVRETCAQTLGVIVKYLDSDGVHGVLGVLLQLLSQDRWEVRHGGLLSLKYLLAVRKVRCHLVFVTH